MTTLFGWPKPLLDSKSSKKSMMEHFTFGDTKAARTLATLVAFDKKSRGKVSVVLERFSRLANELCQIRDLKTRVYFLERLLLDQIRSVKRFNLPKDTESFTITVLWIRRNMFINRYCGGWSEIQKQRIQ
jgi:hypothetical protein